MQLATQVEIVVEVGVEVGNNFDNDDFLWLLCSSLLFVTLLKIQFPSSRVAEWIMMYLTEIRLSAFPNISNLKGFMIYNYSFIVII